MFHFSPLVMSVALVCGQNDGDKVFKAWSALAVGGVWTTTVEGVDVQPRHSYRSLGKGKFIRLNGRGGPFPGVGIMGIDPETKKCTWWCFIDDGAVWISTMSLEKEGVFLLEGTGKGPKDTISFKDRVIRVDQDTYREEPIEIVLNGKKQDLNKVWTWKRQK